jgi:hypothetical protein
MSKETTGPELPDVIYWDIFAGRYCQKKDEYAAPERYLELYNRPGHDYAEHWKVFSKSSGEEARLNIAFDESIYFNLEVVNTIRNLMFRHNNCTPITMIRVGVPEAAFKKYWKEITG